LSCSFGASVEIVFTFTEIGKKITQGKGTCDNQVLARRRVSFGDGRQFKRERYDIQAVA